MKFVVILLNLLLATLFFSGVQSANSIQCQSDGTTYPDYGEKWIVEAGVSSSLEDGDYFFDDIFYLNGGADFSSDRKSVNLLGPTVTEAGTSMFSLEKINVATDFVIEFTVKWSKPVASTSSDAFFLPGFTFAIQPNSYIAMGGAGSALSLNSLNGALAIIYDFGTSNVYSDKGGGGTRMTSVIAPSKSSPTLIKDANSNVSPLSLDSTLDVVVTVLVQPDGSWSVSTDVNMISLYSFTLTKAQVDAVFSDRIAYFGATSSVGSCTVNTNCPTLSITKYLVQAFSPVKLAMVTPVTQYSFQASANRENSIKFQLSSGCSIVYWGEYIFSTSCIQVTQFLSDLDTNPILTLSGDSATGLSYSFSKNANTGIVTLNFSYKKVGTYNLVHSTNETAIDYSIPITITVGSPSPAQSSVEYVSDISNSTFVFVAGQTYKAYVIVRDAYSNLYYKSGALASVSHRFGCCSEVSFSAVDNADTKVGKYLLSVSTTRATSGVRDETLEFKVSGTTIKTLSNLLVVAADPAGSASYLSGDGLTTATVGNDAKISLVVADIYGNKYTEDELNDFIDQGVISMGVKLGDNVYNNDKSALKASDETVEFTYNVETSGTYSLICSITINNSTSNCASTSSVSINVRPGDISATKTIFEYINPNSTTAIVDTSYSVYLSHRDQYNNKISSEVSNDILVSIQVSGKDALDVGCAGNTTTSTPTQATHGITSVSCTFDSTGSYSINFTPVFTGTTASLINYTFTATIDDVAMSQTDFVVEVKSLDADQSKSSMKMTATVYSLIDGEVSSEEVTWDNTQTPGSYTGDVCFTQCIRAGATIKATYTVYDKYGNRPSSSAASIIFSSATADDALAATITSIQTSSNSVYTQNFTFSTATTYTIDVSIGGVTLTKTVKQVTISPSTMNNADSVVSSYSMYYWQTIKVSDTDPTNQWKNVYVITPHDQYDNVIEFAGETDGNKLLIGDASKFSVSFLEEDADTPMDVLPSSITVNFASTEVTITGLLDGEGNAANDYTVPSNTIYFDFVHTYTTDKSTTRGRFLVNYDSKIIATIPVSIIVAAQPHQSVYTTAGTIAEDTDISNTANVPRIESIYLQAGQEQIFSDALCTSTISVYAAYFSSAGKHILTETSFASSLTSTTKNVLARNSFKTSADGIAEIDLLGRAITAGSEDASIKLSSSGITSTYTSSTTATSVLKVNVIHGPPSSTTTIIRPVYDSGNSVFVAANNNISFTVAVLDKYRNVWSNELNTSFTATSYIFPSSEDGSDVSKALSTNTTLTYTKSTGILTANHTYTTAGTYKFITTLKYTHSSGDQDITFSSYTFNVVGSTVNDAKSTFDTTCEGRVSTSCTAGLACYVCIKPLDAYNNAVTLSLSSVTSLSIGSESVTPSSVSSDGDFYRISFIPTKAASTAAAVTVKLASYDSSSTGKFTTQSAKTVAPSATPGTVTVSGLKTLSTTVDNQSITVKAYDKYGNNYSSSTSSYRLTVYPVGGTSTTVATSNMAYISSSSSMVFSALKFTTATTYRFELVLGTTVYDRTPADGSQLASPYPQGLISVTLQAGTPSPKSTVVSKVNVKDSINAGSSIVYSLKYYDTYGNAISMTSTLLSSYKPTIELYENKFTCDSSNAIVTDGTTSTKMEGEIGSPDSDGMPANTNSTYSYTVEVNSSTGAFDITVYTYRANTLESTNLRDRYYVATYIPNSSKKATLIKTCSSTNTASALDLNFITIPTQADPVSTQVIPYIDNAKLVSSSIPAGYIVELRLVFIDKYGNAQTDGIITSTSSQSDTTPSVTLISDEESCAGTGHSTITDDPIYTLNNDSGTASVTANASISGELTFAFGVAIGNSSATYIGTCYTLSVHNDFPYKWSIAKLAGGSIPTVYSNQANFLGIKPVDKNSNIADPSLSAPYGSYNFTITMTYYRSYTSTGENAITLGSGLEGFYIHSATTSVDQITSSDYDSYTYTTMHLANVKPAWPGVYLVDVAINDYSELDNSYALPPFSSLYITVLPSNCYISTGKPIFCTLASTSELGCATAWSECKTNPCDDGTSTDGKCSVTPTCGSDQKTCKVTGANDIEISYCAAKDSSCELDSYLTDVSFRSPTGFISSCPVDQMRCSDGKTCVYDADDCPSSNTCADTQVTCSDGSCKNSAEECSTRVTCEDGKVYVNGNCADEDDVSVTTICSEPSPYKCDDGSCRSSSADCPSSVVCPLDTLLCPNGSCVDDISNCQELQQCDSSMIRCPNGSCAYDISFCGTKLTCPSFAPILCNDGSCVTTIGKCNIKEACSEGTVLCSDGSCTTDFSLCPVESTCHPDYPVKCYDGTCAKTAKACEACLDDDSCNTPINCPSYLPALCSDGSCRKSHDYCPVFRTCPDSLPVRCTNDQCVTDPSLCPTPEDMKCADGFILCKSGACAPDQASCATVLSCPSGQLRCIDGTCRTSCSSLTTNYACGSSKIMCPSTDGGIFCATKLENCPQNIKCPAHLPVRCSDMYCAGTPEECNEVNVSNIPTTRFYCGNGFWASSYEKCGTPITCPSYAPIKCWDQSCRALPEDCPEQHGCSLDSPFLCSDGSCVLNPWSCAIATCTSTGTVRCPFGTSSGAVCVNDISSCPNWLNLNTATSSYKCFFGVRCWDGSCSSEQRYCPDRSCPANLPVLCQNGSCASTTTKCPSLSGCPWDLPYFCPATASCTSTQAACEANASPSCGDGESLCDDGSCRTSCNNVTPFGCNSSSSPNVCADKTCVATPTGTGSDTTIRCLITSDAVNACPVTRPYRCPGGYCATSSSRCPHFDHKTSSWSTTEAVCRHSDAMIDAGEDPMTAFCDDGSCAYSLSQCPIIKPCENHYFRCGDGTCRPPITACIDGFDSPSCRTEVARKGVWSDQCPLTNTCPTGRPYRCQDGLCVKHRDQCIDNYPVILNSCCGSSATYSLPTTDTGIGSCTTTTETCEDVSRDGELNKGCPKLSERCENGMCLIHDTLSRFSDVTCGAYKTTTSNGCAANQHKCPNGSCVDDLSACLLFNGCSPDTPFRCADGSCAATSSDCKAVAACAETEFKCPSGQCVSDYAECTIDNGCPVTSPVRCANGECRKYASKVVLSEGELAEDFCPATPQCPDDKPYLCADYSCVSKSDNCRPVQLCEEPCAIRCPGTLQCIMPPGASGSTCVTISDENIQAVFDELCTSSSKCPPSNPIICPDGSCSESGNKCASIIPQTRFCSSSQPYRCWDGSCASTLQECLKITYNTFTVGGTDQDFANALNNGAPICPNDLSVCPNGRCVSNLSTCEIIPACSNGQQRCGDGSCSDQCDVAIQSCPEGLSPCVDGTCRTLCPLFNGCPMQKPYTCMSSRTQCVSDANECSTSNSSLILEDTDQQVVCEENCDRDVIASEQTLLIKQGSKSITLDVSTTSKGAVRTRLEIPANSYDEDVVFSVYPVPTIFFDGGEYASNVATPYNMTYTDVDSSSSGDFASTVLSTPFRCVVSDTAQSSRLLLPSQSMIYSAYVDTTLYDSDSSAVKTQMPCEMIGEWDAASILNASDDVVNPTDSQKCVADLVITSDSFAIQMEESTCDGDFTLSGTLSSTTTNSAWSNEKSNECLCFTITEAYGIYSGLINKNLCMNAVRSSLGMSIYFEQGFRPTSSGHPDLTKLGSCDGTTTFSSTEDITAYLLSSYTDNNDPCSATNNNSGNIPKQDICFATYTSNKQWECIRDREARISQPTWVDGMPYKLASAAIDDCTGNAYAFMYSVLPDADSDPEPVFCFWCEYGTLILAICIPIVTIFILLVLAVLIVSKYRRAYKEEQDKFKALTERAKELDEYAGGLGIADEDGEAVMVANPLVLQMQELQKQLDDYNQQMDTQGKQEEYEIQRLEMQRQRIKDEMNRMQAELEKQHVEASKPQRIETSGPVLSPMSSGPVGASGPVTASGPVAASGPVTASGPVGGISSSRPMGTAATSQSAPAPRKAREM